MLSSARARASEVADSQPRAHVVLVFSAPAAELESLARAVREVTASLPVRAEVSTLARFDLTQVLVSESAATAPLARIFIALRGGLAKLYIVDERGQRVLVREVPRAGSSPELVHDQLAQIVRAALETLLEGGTVGVPREDIALSPTPKPLLRARSLDRPAGSRAELEIGVAAYYAASTYGSGAALVHGPGLFGSIERAPRLLGWELLASLDYRSIFVRSPSLQLRIHTLPWRLLGGVSAALGSGRLYLELGGGADVSQAVPSAGELTDTVADPFWLVTLALRAQSRIAVQVAKRVWLFSVASLDVDLSATRYVVTLDGRQNLLLDPWTLRPSIGLGLRL